MSRKDVVMTCVYVCDFCGKNQDDVAQMIVGPIVRGDVVCICNECVEECRKAVASNGAS